MTGERFSSIRNALSPLWAGCLMLVLLLPAVLQAKPRQQSTSDKQAQNLVHLLDYMATDYAGAVDNGKVSNKTEYQEMQEFSQNIGQLFNKLDIDRNSDSYREARQHIETLRNKVEEKAAPEQIATLTGQIKTLVISSTGLEVAPRRWPSIDHGKALFMAQCASCHGKTGDGNGELAAQLNPKPTNFHEAGRMKKISPLQAYNTIQLGVEGTSMPSFQKLSDQDAWDLAFYVKSILYKNHNGSFAAGDFQKSGLTLAQVARMNDLELAQAGEGAGSVAAARLHQPTFKSSTYLATAGSMINRALQQFKAGKKDAAYKTAINAYLEGFEPVESQLRAHDASLVTRIEQQMMGIRSKIQNDKPVAEIASDVATIQASLEEAGNVMGNARTTPWIAYILSTSILLREGLEAFLIIITILGVLRSLDAKKEKHWVHAGWIAAVLLGVISWYFTDWLVSFGANWRELMEGGFSLLAVIILVYVGFWMHRNSEVHHWKNFINTKIKEKLQGGNVLGLAAIAFIAVFREAFESVIFLSAISLETAGESNTAIGLGGLSAFLLLLGIGYAMLRLTVKIPLRSIFRYGSYAIGAFSLIMVGQGIHAVQESGLLSVSPAPIPIQASIIGIYPTFETMAAQAITLGVLALLWMYSKK